MKSEYWEGRRGGELCGAFLSFLQNGDYLIVVAECDDASIIMLHRCGEYGLEGSIWVMPEHEEPESS